MLSERRKEKRPQTYDSALSVFAQQLQGQRLWLMPHGHTAQKCYCRTDRDALAKEMWRQN